MNNEIITRGASIVQAERLTIIENRIRDNMNRVAESALDIGRCLNQAKEEKLVPHGQWTDWVRQHTGMSPRAAQYVMKAAREIPATSALASMEFSKVQALLTLPPEERETFAEEVGADNMSVRELKEAVSARQAAERERDEAKKRCEQIKGKADEQMAQAAQERKNLENVIAGLNKKLENVKPDGKAQAEINSLREDVEELEAEIERRAKAEADAKRELLTLRTQVARGFVGANREGLTPDDLADAISAFLGRADVLPYMRTQLANCDSNTRADFREQVERVAGWCERAMRALDAVVIEVEA